jgi:hypothetical protein
MCLRYCAQKRNAQRNSLQGDVEASRAVVVNMTLNPLAQLGQANASFHAVHGQDYDAQQAVS